MPPSFHISSVTGNPNDGTEHAEDAEVSYTVTAVWEASNGPYRALSVLPYSPQMMTQQLTQRFSVEAPIILHPEADFDCLDRSSKPQAWLELPLRTDRSHVPFQCAVSVRSLSGPRALFVHSSKGHSTESCVVLEERKIPLLRRVHDSSEIKNIVSRDRCRRYHRRFTVAQGNCKYPTAVHDHFTPILCPGYPSKGSSLRMDHGA